VETWEVTVGTPWWVVRNREWYRKLTIIRGRGYGATS